MGFPSENNDSLSIMTISGRALELFKSFSPSLQLEQRGSYSGFIASIKMKIEYKQRGMYIVADVINEELKIRLASN